MVAERDVLRMVFEEMATDVYVLGLRSMDPEDLEAFRRISERDVRPEGRGGRGETLRQYAAVPEAASSE